MAKLLTGTRIYGTGTVDTQLFVNGTEQSTSTTTGALEVVGGAGIGGNLYVGGISVLPGVQATNIVASGTLGVTGTTTLGILNAGSATFSGVSTVTNTTAATSTATGALQILGGVGIGGNLYVQQTSYINGSQILTAATIGNFGVSTITAGTDTVVTTSTGAVLIYNTGTLQSVTNRGAVTTNQLNLNNGVIFGSTANVPVDFAGNYTNSVGSFIRANGFMVGTTTTTALYALNFQHNLAPVSTTTINSYYGNLFLPTLQNTATYNNMYGTFARIDMAAAATSGTVGTWYGFFSANPTRNAAANVPFTSHIGFYAENPGAITATNVYGVQSVIASGTNRYNIYASGTANNYFNGNVGIGGLPTVKLDITGDVKISGITTVTNNTAATSTITGALQVIGGVGIGGNLYVGGTTSSFIGNVGIGTVAPTWKVDTNLGNITGPSISTGGYNVTGDATSSVGYTTYNMQLNNSTANASGYMRLARTASTAYLGMQIGSQSRDGIAFLTGSVTPVEYVRITSTGSVGIGITSPTAKLHVSGTSGKSGGILVEDSSDSSSAPAVEIIGKRSDGNISSAFAGKILLASNRTDAATGSSKHLGSVAFGGNHTDGTLTNILYSASISGISENTFSNATTMPTALVFYTSSTGVSPDTANITIGTERMRVTSTGALAFSGATNYGTSGQILQSNGNAAPTWVTATGLAAGSATNIAGGTAGQVPYQTAPGTTSFYGPGTAGNVLVSNGTSAPSYNNTLILAGTTAATSTATGALQVRGGVGIGDNLYVGGDLFTRGTKVIPLSIQEFTATVGQTIFTVTGGYTVGTVQVFANGINLGSADIVASNGATVTLLEPRAVGDIIRVISGGTSSSVNNIQNFSIAMSIAMSM